GDFLFSSRRRHTRSKRDWSSDVCSSDLDKHVEVMVRQMLKKVKVIDSGDTDVLPGSLLDVNEFKEVNNKILLEGKEPAVIEPVLLGITKASLETDSFLSA